MDRCLFAAKRVAFPETTIADLQLEGASLGSGDLRLAAALSLARDIGLLLVEQGNGNSCRRFACCYVHSRRHNFAFIIYTSLDFQRVLNA